MAYDKLPARVRAILDFHTAACTRIAASLAEAQEEESLNAQSNGKMSFFNEKRVVADSLKLANTLTENRFGPNALAEINDLDSYN